MINQNIFIVNIFIHNINALFQIERNEIKVEYKKI